ncbi:MAG: L,D-transpeptidase family protein [Gammaproteobacteria bacterium]
MNPERLPELKQSVVTDFYRARAYKLLWSNEAGRFDRAYDLLQVIIHANDEGLEPSDYYLEAIRKYWNSTELGESVPLDLLLTAALYRYANDVYAGRFDSRKVDADWNIQNEPVDMRSLYAQVAGRKSIEQLLKQLPPKHAGYQLLKKQLRHYRELAQQGGWQRLPWGPVLERGMQHEQVVQLKRRLEMTADLVDHPFPEVDVYDQWLEQAVMRYQTRHGLEVDGKVGPQTRRSLNIAVSERLRQIRINMERWRWLQRDLGKRYLLVNMTGFELYVIENESVVLSMPVIIGKPYRATPTFSGLVSYMEYNPYWTIPLNLVFADIIPRQKGDPTYLEGKSIKLYRGWTKPREIDPQTVDWSSLDKERFPYWLRQEPGPKNALGRIKFIVSNPYEIYLHGTPDAHLFDRVVRTFSSGCIRVKDPVALAAFLLNDGSQQKQEEVLENIHLGTNQGVILPVAVPIYLVYLTAWVDQDGTMHFRKDIYQRDTRLNELFDNLAAQYVNKKL